MFIIKGNAEMAGCSDHCKDACGDEDNCCEYGFDYRPDFISITIKDLIR